MGGDATITKQYLPPVELLWSSGLETDQTICLTSNTVINGNKASCDVSLYSTEISFWAAEISPFLSQSTEAVDTLYKFSLKQSKILHV